MDLERVAIEAVKEKVQEIFNKINVIARIEGKNIIISIELPDEIMNTVQEKTEYKISGLKPIEGLDKDAQAAADELLGTQPFIPQE